MSNHRYGIKCGFFVAFYVGQGLSSLALHAQRMTLFSNYSRSITSDSSTKRSSWVSINIFLLSLGLKPAHVVWYLSDIAVKCELWWAVQTV